MLHAQKGMWNGQQILSPDWVKAATSEQVPEGPYGYQWWMGPGGAYYALGLFTQLAVVFPEHRRDAGDFLRDRRQQQVAAPYLETFPGGVRGRFFADRP